MKSLLNHMVKCYMSSEKSLMASIWSVIISLGLTGVLQIAILVLGLVAGYYAVKKNKAESELAQIRLDKLAGKRGEHEATETGN